MFSCFKCIALHCITCNIYFAHDYIIELFVTFIEVYVFCTTQTFFFLLRVCGFQPWLQVTRWWMTQSYVSCWCHRDPEIPLRIRHPPFELLGAIQNAQKVASILEFSHMLRPDSGSRCSWILVLVVDCVRLSSWWVKPQKSWRRNSSTIRESSWRCHTCFFHRRWVQPQTWSRRVLMYQRTGWASSAAWHWTNWWRKQLHSLEANIPILGWVELVIHFFCLA